MMEHKKLKAAFGGFFSITTIVSSLFFVSMDMSAVEASYSPQEIVINLQTHSSAAKVLPEYTGVSQEFHFGHPGIDITAALGSKIYPIKSGRVVEIGNTKWNYGRWVVLDHGNDIKTLYAHMGKIYVQEGEEVNTEQSIGEIGLTGKTTGPHLHLEIMKDDQRVNPRPYLELNKKK
jgi:murein DD-endopeptidase MepM/ murein hydrolase activator NlpD